MNIGELIHKRRTELDLTLEEVGNAVGVSKSTVKKWEDGFISNMRRDKISALAKVLHINPVSLITGELVLTNQTNDFYLSEHEKRLVIAYRQNPHRQDSVDTLLGIAAVEEQNEEKRA